MKKIRSMVALLLVVIMAFTACSTNNNESKTETKPDTVVETDSKLAGELTYWSMWNSTEPQALAIEEGINEFMVMHPNVKVTINWNGREIRKTLQPALDNGQTVDIWDEDLERVTKNWKDYALNLNDYITKSYPGTDGKTYEESVMGSLLDLARYYSEEDSVYAVPYQPFVFAFMYNKAHFAEAGIDAAPQNWDDFLVACEKLKEAGFVPMTTDDAYIDTLLGYHLSRYKGYAWVEELVKDKTNEMWNDEAVINTANDFQNLVDNGYISETVGSNKWPAGQQDIAAGTVSMYLNGTWLVNEIMGSTGPDFEWGTFSYPAVEGGVNGVSAANYGSQAFQISKNCENPEVAFELLVHLTTGKWDSEIAQKSFGVPVSGTAQWPSQLVEAKGVFEKLDTVYPWAGGIQADTDKLPIIAAAFTNLLSGQFNAEEFLEAVK